jgi:hypothetical protein
LNFTPKDIELNHANSDRVQEILKIALATLPALGIKGVLQGDVIFTKSSLFLDSIDGQEMVLFKPNTLTYGVPLNSPLAKDILSAQLGIVWHTEYKGSEMSKMKASFSPDITKLKKIKDVWFDDATLKNVSSGVQFNKTEISYLNSLIEKAKQSLKSIRSFADELSNSPISTHVKAYSNILVRTGKQMTVSDIPGLIEYVSSKYRSAYGKERHIKFLVDNQSSLVELLKYQLYIVELKSIILKKLNQISSMSTFIQTGDGFRVTGQEGFVALNSRSGRVIKLVDRLEFSRLNFSFHASLNEGGNAIIGVSRLDQENAAETIKAAISAVSSVLNIEKSDLRVLGSAGKKLPGESSGDIDIAISAKSILSTKSFNREELFDFVVSKIKRISASVKDSRGLGIVSFAFPIVNINKKQHNKSVQVDLMLVNNLDYSEWIYYGPATSESEFKGIYRNILLNQIAKFVALRITKSNSGQPIEQQRLLLDYSKGLFFSTQSREGKRGITKNFQTKSSAFISTTPKIITELLFGPKFSPSDLLVFEKVLSAVLSPDFIYPEAVKSILKGTDEALRNEGLAVPEVLNRLL